MPYSPRHAQCRKEKPCITLGICLCGVGVGGRSSGVRNRFRKQKGGNCFAAVIIPDQVHSRKSVHSSPWESSAAGDSGIQSQPAGCGPGRGAGLKSYSKNVAPPTGENGQQCVEGRGRKRNRRGEGMTGPAGVNQPQATARGGRPLGISILDSSALPG